MMKIEEEVRRLIGFGDFDITIAKRLGISKEEVHKIRMEVRTEKWIKKYCRI